MNSSLDFRRNSTFELFMFASSLLEFKVAVLSKLDVSHEALSVSNFIFGAFCHMNEVSKLT